MAKKQTAKVRAKPVTGSWTRYGIKNHVGGIWTPETFETIERAQKFLDDRRASWPGGGDGLKRHRVVKVRVTVTAVERKKYSKIS